MLRGKTAVVTGASSGIGASTVRALTDDTRTLALPGLPAQWAFPGADTVTGAQYAARGVLAPVQRSRTR